MADVVVVGGGILGLCTAFHLKELGVDQVVLLEREPALATQTTAAGAGFAAYWAAEALEAELARDSIAFYSRLQEESGADLGVRRAGLLFPALSSEGVEFLRGLQRSSRFAPGLDLIAADDACALVPIIAPGTIAGALHQPDAHEVPTTRVAAALERRLLGRGVEIRRGVEVDRAVLAQGRVVAVETSAGSIPAGAIVNVAGAGARALGLRNGISIPAVPLLESRYVTEPLPEVAPDLPMLLFVERDLLYLRPEAGGLLVGAVERRLDSRSCVPLKAPPRASALSTHAAEDHERLARGFAAVVPVLGRARVASRVSGLPTWTPDHRHVLGLVPGLDGYVVLAGCNERGVSHGPGLGRLAAELAVRGTTVADIDAYRVDRFDGLGEAELLQRAKSRYLARHPETLNDAA